MNRTPKIGDILRLVHRDPRMHKLWHPRAIDKYFVVIKISNIHSPIKTFVLQSIDPDPDWDKSGHITQYLNSDDAYFDYRFEIIE